MDQIDFPTVIAKFDQILERGLCAGVGQRDGQMCVEAAICAAMDLPHGDDPVCVEPAVRAFKILLNDAVWSSPQARAAGLRDLGIAQIGSAGVVDGVEFARRMTEQTIRVLIPVLFRDIFTQDTELHRACRAVATRCEVEGSRDAAAAAATAAVHYTTAYAASAYAANAAAAANAVAYVYAAAAAATAYAAAAYAADKYLRLSASLALAVLREMKSPGCAWV
jgi:hypothetical protein